MSTLVGSKPAGNITNIGEHGHRRQAPGELNDFMTELLAVCFPDLPDLSFDLRMESFFKQNCRYVFKPVRVQKDGVYTQCQPPNAATENPNHLGVLTINGLDHDVAFRRLRQVCKDDGITHEQWPAFKLKGQVPSSLDSVWTEERKLALAEPLMQLVTDQSRRVNHFRKISGDDMIRLLRSILPARDQPKRLDEWKGHIDYLQSQGWLEIFSNNSRRWQSLRFIGGGQVRLLFAKRMGAVPDDRRITVTSDEFHRFMEEGDFLAREHDRFHRKRQELESVKAKADARVEERRSKLRQAKAELDLAKEEQANLDYQLKQLTADEGSLRKLNLEWLPSQEIHPASSLEQPQDYISL